MGVAGDIADTLVGAVLPFVLIFSLIILVHELGHYGAARLYRLPVTRFSLGFGPRLAGWHDRRGTEWVLAAVPLGGFVKVGFDQRRGARAVVIAAGPLANLALAAALLFLQQATVGLYDARPVVAAVIPNSPAAAAGILPGDRVMSMNGRRVSSFGEIQRYVGLHLDRPVAFTLERNGAYRTVQVAPIVATLAMPHGRSEPLGLTGLVGGPPERLRVGIGTAAAAALHGTAYLVGDTLAGLRQLITGERSYNSMMGVVGIADMTAAVVETSGVLSLLAFAALLSVNIAVVNALPLPALDGGQLLLALLEGALRRPLPGSVYGYANAVGIGVLTALLLLTTWNDVRFLV